MESRTLLAALWGGLAAGTVLADPSSLVISGRAAAQTDSVQATGATDPAGDIPRHQRVANVASRLRFQGTEELDGMQAIFFLEAGIPLTGTGPSGFGAPGTQNYVGLAGKFGELTLGTRNRPFYSASLVVDPWDILTLGAIDAVIYEAPLKIGAGESGFQIGDALHYVSPEWGGFRLRAAYGFGENKDNTPANAHSADEHSAAASYGAGPFYVALGARARAGAAGGRSRSYGLVGSYKISGGPKLGAIYEWHRSNETGASKRIDDWAITMSWPIGPHELRANYERDSGVKTDPDPADTRSRHWAVGYAYHASKRTELYIQYAKLKNGPAVKNNFDTGISGVAPGADPKGYAIGIIHYF